MVELDDNLLGETFDEEEFLLGRYHDINYIMEMEINHYVSFLMKAKIAHYNKVKYDKWIGTGACNKYSLKDYKLKLLGKETSTEKSKRLQSLNI